MNRIKNLENFEMFTQMSLRINFKYAKNSWFVYNFTFFSNFAAKDFLRIFYKNVNRMNTPNQKPIFRIGLSRNSGSIKKRSSVVRKEMLQIVKKIYESLSSSQTVVRQLQRLHVMLQAAHLSVTLLKLPLRKQSLTRRNSNLQLNILKMKMMTVKILKVLTHNLCKHSLRRKKKNWCL